MYGSLPGFELIYPGPKVVTLPVCYTPLTSLVFLVKAFISLSTSLVYVCLVKKGLLGVTSIVAPLIGQIVYYLSWQNLWLNKEEREKKSPKHSVKKYQNVWQNKEKEIEDLKFVSEIKKLHWMLAKNLQGFNLQLFLSRERTIDIFKVFQNMYFSYELINRKWRWNL